MGTPRKAAASVPGSEIPHRAGLGEAGGRCCPGSCRLKPPRVPSGNTALQNTVENTCAASAWNKPSWGQQLIKLLVAWRSGERKGSRLSRCSRRAEGFVAAAGLSLGPADVASSPPAKLGPWWGFEPQMLWGSVLLCFLCTGVTAGASPPCFWGLFSCPGAGGVVPGPSLTKHQLCSHPLMMDKAGDTLIPFFSSLFLAKWRPGPHPTL